MVRRFRHRVNAEDWPQRRFDGRKTILVKTTSAENQQPEPGCEPINPRRRTSSLLRIYSFGRLQCLGFG
jgi:hypothetical protein